MLDTQRANARSVAVRLLSKVMAKGQVDGVTVYRSGYTLLVFWFIILKGPVDFWNAAILTALMGVHRRWVSRCRIVPSFAECHCVNNTNANCLLRRAESMDSASR
jgi:hypothetical protein